MDLDQILPQLVAGSCPKTPEDVETLAQEYGVTAVLCLQTERETAEAEIDWNHLESRYRESDIEVHRVPVPGCDPDGFRGSLPEAVQALDRLLRDGHKVYIHCSLGACRAPTVIVAYLHWAQDWEMGEALDYVTACRSCSPDVEVLKAASEDRLRERPESLNVVSV